MSRLLSRRIIGSTSMVCLFLVICVVSFPWAMAAHAAGETVSVWLTTPDQANLLKPQSNLTFGGVGSNSTTITVNDAQTYQQMVGFGASLVDSSAWLIYNKMSQSQRNQLMTNLFDPNNGIGLSFLRQPIGASDMALNEYTYDDVASGQTDPTLSHFSISHDSAYIIPLLQQALQLNHNLKIMATPWTAPAWMKSNGSLEQGSLNASAFQVYAQYLADFIKAYQAQGIPIFAITPQNEPGNNNRMPTMPMSASDETTFIANNLGPTLAQNGLSTKILGYDHNWDNPGYPTTILNNSTAASYVSGTAWHCYGGDASTMTTFHNSYPAKDTYETECSGGTWEGSNWPSGFKSTVELGINSARNWAKGVLRWSLALDPNGNPHVNSPDSCSTCRGIVTIDQGTGNVTYNSDYYGFGQFSKFVVPGAYAIASNSFGSGNIEDVAFKNPDGSKVLVVYNGGGGSNTFQVNWNNEAFSYTLPAGAAATFKWSGSTTTPTPTPTIGSTPTPPTPTPTPTSGSYNYITNLHSGLALDNSNGSGSNGTLLQLWAQSNGNTNQEWSLVPADTGYYYIVNRHTGLAFDDTNGSTSNGTQIQLWAQTNGNTNQEWSLVSAGNGDNYIINRHSGLALDNTNGSTSNGTIVQQWAQSNGNANQEWSLLPA